MRWQVGQARRAGAAGHATPAWSKLGAMASATALLSRPSLWLEQTPTATPSLLPLPAPRVVLPRPPLSSLAAAFHMSLPSPYPTFSGTAALSAAASPPSFLASSATALADRSTDSHPAFSCAQASRDSASTHGCSCSQQPPLHMGGARAGKNCLKARPPPLCSCTRFGRRHCALSHASHHDRLLETVSSVCGTSRLLLENRLKWPKKRHFLAGLRPAPREILWSKKTCLQIYLAPRTADLAVLCTVVCDTVHSCNVHVVD